MIIRLRFTPGEDGDTELEVLYKADLAPPPIPVPLSICRESRAYTFEHFPDVAPPLSVSAASKSKKGDGMHHRDRNKGVVFFDADTLERLELHQTGPLRQVADVEAVAIEPRTLDTRGGLEDALMVIYSRLRDISRIAIVTDDATTTPGNRKSRGSMDCDDLCCRYATTAPLVISRIDLPSQEYQQYQHFAQLCTHVVQSIIGNKYFWRDYCNPKYVLEQILPVSIMTSSPRVPTVELVRLTTVPPDCNCECDCGCGNHESPPSSQLPRIRIPEWMERMMKESESGNLEKNKSKCENESADHCEDAYSLRDLLD